MTGPGNSSLAESVDVGGDDGPGCVECFEVDGQLLQDVGLDDMKDLDGPVQ